MLQYNVTSCVSNTTLYKNICGIPITYTLACTYTTKKPANNFSISFPVINCYVLFIALVQRHSCFQLIVTKRVYT